MNNFSHKIQEFIHFLSNYFFVWLFNFCREWTGDLKKLPNIKLRKVSKKGLDAKNEGKEEKCDAADDVEDEDDLSDEELDDALLMAD